MFFKIKERISFLIYVKNFINSEKRKTTVTTIEMLKLKNFNKHLNTLYRYGVSSNKNINEM